ncbi:hypothetical protein AB685_11085 [Bacillus sp. LL01]|uniref:DUF6241 domain-containing protein n=1 Tax=Bacillus sp. LL01 TaxID=1665556 RepID=UPI00064D097A|nr:DUF6241 domain-containing protein [Bacillus sp. LL01]KMJ58427.1 hypothetical protein AB685_11085 [Bacillus sp. LL01]
MKNWLKTNKRKLFPFVAVLLLAGALVTYYIYTSPLQESGSSGILGNRSSSQSSGSKGITVEKDNPFKHKNKLNEVDVQNYIHWMSHQKVKAESKWTHYKLTDERVDWLLQRVKEGNYKHEQLYVEILTKWQNDDFSTADMDHNRVWALQNGNVGKATGIMSEKEEKAYLQNPNIKFK